MSRAWVVQFYIVLALRKERGERGGGGSMVRVEGFLHCLKGHSREMHGLKIISVLLKDKFNVSYLPQKYFSTRQRITER